MKNPLLEIFAATAALGRGVPRLIMRIGDKSFGRDDKGPNEIRMENESKDKHRSRAVMGWQIHVPQTWNFVQHLPGYEVRKGGVIWKVPVI